MLDNLRAIQPSLNSQALLQGQSTQSISQGNAQSTQQGVQNPHATDSFEGIKSATKMLSKEEALALRDEIIAISKEHTTNTKSIKDVRARIEPKLEKLENYFAANRPENEVELTRGVWKSVWYDDPDIGDRGPLKLNRERIWQVVRDGYYYNVSDSDVRLGKLKLGRLSNYLKGAYSISNTPTPENKGEKRLNVINLEFVYNGMRLGGLPEGKPVNTMVDKVENSCFGSVKIPGPYGVKGELWNIYVDDKVRISAGFNKENPEVLDLYILEKGDKI